MKSICGYWALDGAPTPAQTLSKMSVAGVHSPSPHVERWQQHEVAFGSAWWSPQTGLKASQCVARHEGTGCVVVADARLDNPAELRAALSFPEDSLTPDSATDNATALIMQAWLHWGEACVAHLDGDFTFAVWDPRINAIFIARDRMAGRPLYVHHQPGRLLVFGSSAHAVLAYPRVPRERNEARIADFLIEGLEGVDVTSTFYLAVERHPSAHTLLVTPQQYQLRRYWQLQPGKSGPLPQTDNEWAEALTEAMERAVAQRLVGPARVGSMLSGGLDSTSLAIIAGEQLRDAGRPALPTFSSIDSDVPDCAETLSIRVVANLPIFSPTLIDSAKLGGRRAALEKFLDDFDEPFDAHMNLIDAQYLAAAGADVDSVMDGIDGDTLFSAGDTLRRQIRSFQWSSAMRNARGLAGTHRGGALRELILAGRSALLPSRARKWLWPFRSHQSMQQFLDRSLISYDFARQVNVAERLQRLREYRSLSPWANPQMEASEGLQHPYVVVAIERYGRVANRHGVTPLHPYTDRRLLELCVNFPDRQRVRDGWRKPVLRYAMNSRMPAAVLNRTDKQHLGWQFTQAIWRQRGDQLQKMGSSQRTVLAAYVDLKKLDDATKICRISSQTVCLREILYAVRLGTWLGKTCVP